MVKTAVDVKRIVARFVIAAEKQIAVQRVILAGDYARGRATDDSDIRLLVISPSFEGMDWLQRTSLLARVGRKVDVLVQSWGFTPAELENWSMIPFLSMMLNESRQLYPDPADEDGAGGLR